MANVLNAAASFTSKWLVLCYVNFTSTKKKFLMKKKKCSVVVIAAWGSHHKGTFPWLLSGNHPLMWQTAPAPASSTCSPASLPGPVPTALPQSRLQLQDSLNALSWVSLACHQNNAALSFRCFCGPGPSLSTSQRDARVAV